MQVKPATRSGVKPLVGFYGKSGSGKTMSALLLARGIAGLSGKITLIDTENGRGSIFADLIPGGYNVLDLEAPFSPARYEEAIVEAEKSADVVLVDSMSHEWSGEGGVLDWAEEELQRMGGGDNNKMRSWIKPKMAHKMMVQRLLRTKCALICCLRGEQKTHMGKDSQNKTVVVTDEFSTPLFDPRFIFEMLINLETVAHDGRGGFVIPRKITHPSVGSLLPDKNTQITIEHGRALARWCSQVGAPAENVEISVQPVSPPKQNASQGELGANSTPKTVRELEIELWQVLKPVRKAGQKEWGKSGALDWLYREEVLDGGNPEDVIPGLSAERLEKAIAISRELLT